MLQTLDIKENDHILIIAPHPDDECIGPGGLLARYPGQCRVIVLTDGREGQGDAAPERVKAVREREFQEEMSFLGIADYRMLGYEDGTLLRHTDCLEQIGLAGYTKIFVTGMHDNHPDHTAAYLSVRQALQKQGIGESEVYLYEVHAPLQCPTHLLDITDRMEEKQQLFCSFKNPFFAVTLNQMLQLSLPESPMLLLPPERIRLEAERLFSKVELSGTMQEIQGLDGFMVRHYGTPGKADLKNRLKTRLYYIKCVK